MRALLKSTITVACLSGCASVGLQPATEITLSTWFDPQEVAWFSGEGSATITGQAFIQTRGGQPRTCAGLNIDLHPRSRYGDERLAAIYGDVSKGFAKPMFANFRFTPDEPLYYSTMRQSVCDAQGNFLFENLPAGDYFLTTSIRWSIPGQEFGPPQGGHLMEKITVANGESKRVIMTP